MLRKQLLELNTNQRNGTIDQASAPLITASIMQNMPLGNRIGSPGKNFLNYLETKFSLLSNDLLNLESQ